MQYYYWNIILIIFNIVLSFPHDECFEFYIQQLKSDISSKEKRKLPKWISIKYWYH